MPNYESSRRHRSRMYWAGFCGIYLSTILSVSCVILPRWMEVEQARGGVTEMKGLWMTCDGGFGNCSTVQLDEYITTLAKFLLLTGCIFHVLNLVSALCRHIRLCKCVNTTAGITAVEICSIVGGFLCFSGTLMWKSSTEHLLDIQRHFGIAMYLSLFSSVLVMNAGCVLLILNRGNPRREDN